MFKGSTGPVANLELARARRRFLQSALQSTLALGVPGLAAAAGMSGLAGMAGAPPVPLARTHQIDGVFAGRMRRVFVAVPEGPVPAQGHPVLWTLDGNTAFPLMAALLRQRAARPADVRGVVPVVVGLGLPTDDAYDQAARAADYTLPNASGGGQADRFLDALEEQLKPWLAKQLPVDPTRQTLFGHSFGGLFTLYALFTRPTLFQRHVAASPSIWWGERAILGYRDNFLQRVSSGVEPAHHLLVTAGSLEEGMPGATAERLRRQQERRQVSSARELVQSLSGVPKLRPEFRLLDGEDHGSLVLPSAVLAIELAMASA
jgi:uncharacterized protein